MFLSCLYYSVVSTSPNTHRSVNGRNPPGNFMKIHKTTLNSVSSGGGLAGVERKGRQSSPSSSAPDGQSPPLCAPRCQTSPNPGVRCTLRFGVSKHPRGAHGVFAGRRWDRDGLQAAPRVGAPAELRTSCCVSVLGCLEPTNSDWWLSSTGCQ